WDYALDLKNFHESSHKLCIVPVLISTNALPQSVELQRTIHDDGLVRPVRSNPSDLPNIVTTALEFFEADTINSDSWERGRYLPTPTIIEAARALYAGHSVESISRSEAGAKNLAITSKAVDNIIQSVKTRKTKAVCFVTGVPGAGKTLVGLDIANRH